MDSNAPVPLRSAARSIRSHFRRWSGQVVANPAVRRVWPRPLEAVLGLFALLVIGVACLSHSRTVAQWASTIGQGNKYTALAEGMLNPFRNRHLLTNSGLPIYDLRVSYREHSILENIAEQALKHGWMHDGLKEWAKGELIHDGTSYNVDIRLRGIFKPHWQGVKKSYRIKFGKQKVTDEHGEREEPIYFNGKHEINLIIPSDKGFALGPFVNEVLRDYGLVVPRDRWVILRINGALHGLYYEAEHFDKPMLASHDRPETSVFGQNSRAMHYEPHSPKGQFGPRDAHNDIGTVQRQIDTEGDLGLRCMQELIDFSLKPSAAGFRRVRELIDWDKYLPFRAMTTLFNTNHVKFGTDNLKLYFDASRGLLEPVPWDLHFSKMLKEPGTIDFFTESGPDELVRAMLLDPELRLRRNQVLWEMLGEDGDKLLKRYDKLHDEIRTLVWADVLRIPIQGYNMDEIRKDLKFNIERTCKVLAYSSADATYRLESDERAAFEVASLNYSGILFDGLELLDPQVLQGEYRLIEDSNDDGGLDDSDEVLSRGTAESGRVVLPIGHCLLPEVQYGSLPIHDREWFFYEPLMTRRRFFIAGRLALENRDPIEWKAPEIIVHARNAVTGREIPCGRLGGKEDVPDNAIGITAYDTSDPWDIDAIHATRTEFLAKHPEFRASTEGKGAVGLSGKVSLSGTVIVPRDVPLILQPGAEIVLAPKACVVCYGGLRSVGTLEQRIRIRGDDSGRPWGTFAVLRPPDKVVVHYTDFEDGGQAQVNATLFTGGFAVHDGDLDLQHCLFSDMQSEDGLNLKNGAIFMKDCIVRDTASDAMDLDFVTGEVCDSLFLNTGGDGVDFSGSTARVTRVRCENIGDKGFSVGENSHPTIVDCLMRRCVIGMSCKDLSHPRVAHCTFSDNKLAIEAKRKKPFFGGGSGEFLYCVFAGNEKLFEEDYFSRGLVEVKQSILDQPSRWKECTTATATFVAPDSGDFRLDAKTLQGITLKEIAAEWIGLQSSDRRIPGMLSIPAVQEDRQTGSELQKDRADSDAGNAPAEGSR